MVVRFYSKPLRFEVVWYAAAGTGTNRLLGKNWSLGVDCSDPLEMYCSFGNSVGYKAEGRFKAQEAGFPCRPRRRKLQSVAPTLTMRKAWICYKTITFPQLAEATK